MLMEYFGNVRYGGILINAVPIFCYHSIRIFFVHKKLDFDSVAGYPVAPPRHRANILSARIIDPLCRFVGVEIA